MMLLASAGHGPRKPLKLKQHIPVKSKVKQQLQQANALHEQRGKARKHRLQTALGPRSALLLQICIAKALAAGRFTTLHLYVVYHMGLTRLKHVTMLPACCLDLYNAAPGCRLDRLPL